VGTPDFLQDITDQSVRVLERIEDLKLFLAFAQTADPDSGRWESAQRDARALAIVCAVAELEALTRFTIQRAHEELNAASLPVDRFIPSIRQIVAHNTFESLRLLQDPSKMWERRLYATTLETCIEIAQFPIVTNHPQPPLDGRTLRPEHFHRLWNIYSLPGYAFPRSAWNASLVKLALIRNDIAHGNLPYVEIFQQAGRSIKEVEGYVNHMQDFVAHFHDVWSEYMLNQKYLLP
jgi:hypothetical protein